MPIYITDLPFFSDHDGIFSTDTNSASTYGRYETENPAVLSCTGRLLPRDISVSFPALFLLDEENYDPETSRLHSLFQELNSQGYAVFHFQISRQDNEEMFSDFEQLVQDLAEQYPHMDPDRLYIGGFGRAVSAMLYVTGHTKIFRGAFSLNAFTNITTAYGNYENSHRDFINSGFSDFKSWLYAKAEKCPLQFLDTNTTPYLILHGHRDYICPEEQSEELFSAIKDRTPEVPCRMLIFPNENHNILKVGHTTYQETITREILDWFTRFGQQS